MGDVYGVLLDHSFKTTLGNIKTRHIFVLTRGKIAGLDEVFGVLQQ
jgi:hypothetical protein